MRLKKLHTGFTLMELLLVIGILAILATIIIAAINPTRQLGSARDAQKRSDVNQLKKAIVQYVIDGNAPPATPSDANNAINICSGTLTGATCTSSGTGYDASFLVPDYLIDIPRDPEETNPDVSGYKIYKINGTFIEVCSAALTDVCG